MQSHFSYLLCAAWLQALAVDNSGKKFTIELKLERVGPNGFDTVEHDKEKLPAERPVDVDREMIRFVEYCCMITDVVRDEVIASNTDPSVLLVLRATIIIRTAGSTEDEVAMVAGSINLDEKDGSYIPPASAIHKNDVQFET